MPTSAGHVAIDRGWRPPSRANLTPVATRGVSGAVAVLIAERPTRLLLLLMCSVVRLAAIDIAATKSGSATNARTVTRGSNDIPGRGSTTDAVPIGNQRD